MKAFGEDKTLTMWAADPRCQVSQPTLSERLMKGMSLEEAITTPPTRNNGAAKKAAKIGDIFGRLTVIEGPWLERRGNQMASKVKVQCSCGGPNMYKEVFVNALRGKGQCKTTSCGCVKAEKASWRTTIRNTTHSMSKHGLYSQYNAMISRCYRSNYRQYDNYGGRGITVCKEWKNSFEVFAKWALENGWTQGLTIERKNNNEGYSPANCKWATLVEQANNKRSNHHITAFNETKTIAEWARDGRAKAGYQSILERVIKLGWGPEEAISTPSRKFDRTNQSGIRGVSYVKETGRWKAYISVNGNRIHIGHYLTKEEAAQARIRYVEQSKHS
jgi:hypothetical protein